MGTQTRRRASVAWAATLVVCACAAGSAGAAVPTGNLLQNPGAEGGDPDEPPGWTSTNEFRVERYGSEFFPSTAVGAAFGGGTSFFAGGGAEGGTISSGVQVVDVSGAAAEIDAGDVTADLRAYLGGADDEGDQATVTADYRAGQSAVGTGLTVGPVTHTDRGDQTKFLLRTASGKVPAGTRQIRVTITVIRTYGSYSDGYADNLSLTLTGGGTTPAPPGTPTAPPPTGTTPGSPTTPGTPTTPGSQTPPSPQGQPVIPVKPSSPIASAITGVAVAGSTVSGAIATSKPLCKPGRTVTVKKGRKTLGSGRSRANGRFTVSSKKIKKAKGKVTVTVKRRTLTSKGVKVTCAAIVKQV